MKKRIVWSLLAIAALLAMFWAAAQLLPARSDLAALFPDNALLYIEAKDFRSLLADWNNSEQKRAWIEGDDYQAFSRSRLFQRLGQAQDEFSAAATIGADNHLLSSIAGTQSALALYNIGDLEFVYITRMSQPQIEATALWQVREKFELRTEGAAQFYVRQDEQSNRTAAFAAREGWLILSSRPDLVAGVLDRLQSSHTHNLSDEAWYADVLKQAPGPAGELRMVLNLEKLVPSPYFRSYWVQQNITELKQYRSALSDLHRTRKAYTEERVLLRKSAIEVHSGNVQELLALAPDDAVFCSAQAAPSPDRVLTELRENLLDLKSAESRERWSAPSAVAAENAGSASMLEKRIDLAPAVVVQSDPYQPLRTMLIAVRPAAMSEVYTTRAPKGEIFVGIDRAIVLEAASHWDEVSIHNALSGALRSGLTTSQLGIEWARHSGPFGDYFALSGEVSLFSAVRENRLFLSTSQTLLTTLLSRSKTQTPAAHDEVTYAALFRHTPLAQDTAHQLFRSLDTNAAGNAGEGGQEPNGQPPSFFSGNVIGLSRMFRDVATESIQEKDQGAQVMQSVVYTWLPQ